MQACAKDACRAVANENSF